jgi:FkbM family methyltransferase
MTQENIIIGEFSREDDVSIDESRMVASFFAGRGPGVCIDVGAHHGGSAKHFLEMGWTVHAFEPDGKNRSVLERLWGGHPGLTIDPRAVADEASGGRDFYASEESTGISGLSAFTPGHEKVGTVEVVTLSEIVGDRNITGVDFLKIDTEGFDFFVLKGFAWDVCPPEVILCEFDDAKTKPLGYGVHDMGEFLLGKGYQVFVCEWHPIVRYGIRHQFRRLAAYPSELVSGDAWGNLLAFRTPFDGERLKAGAEAACSAAG